MQQKNDDSRPNGTASDPTFDAVVEAGPLQAAIDAVAALVDECVVEAGPDGLAVAAQDPATVALVSLSLPASAFESYEASGTDLGVDLGRLGDVVGMADGEEPVRLALDAATRTLDVRVGELAYTLGLIDPETIRSPPDLSDLSERYDADVTLDGHEVVHFVRATDMVADHLELAVDGDAFVASAEGDTDAVRVEHPAEECEAFDAAADAAAAAGADSDAAVGADADGDAAADTAADGDAADAVAASSLFSVSYLDAVAGAVPRDAPVRIQFGDGEPVEFTFEGDGGSVRYVVAPRIRRT